MVRHMGAPFLPSLELVVVRRSEDAPDGKESFASFVFSGHDLDDEETLRRERDRLEDGSSSGVFFGDLLHLMNDVSISFPELDLTFHSNSTFALTITLETIYRYHLKISAPFRAIVKEEEVAPLSEMLRKWEAHAAELDSETPESLGPSKIPVMELMTEVSEKDVEPRSRDGLGGASLVRPSSEEGGERSKFQTSTLQKELQVDGGLAEQGVPVNEGPLEPLEDVEPHEEEEAPEEEPEGTDKEAGGEEQEVPENEGPLEPHEEEEAPEEEPEGTDKEAGGEEQEVPENEGPLEPHEEEEAPEEEPEGTDKEAGGEEQEVPENEGPVCVAQPVEGAKSGDDEGDEERVDIDNGEDEEGGELVVFANVSEMEDGDGDDERAAKPGAVGFEEEYDDFEDDGYDDPRFDDREGEGTELADGLHVYDDDALEYGDDIMVEDADLYDDDEGGVYDGPEDPSLLPVQDALPDAEDLYAADPSRMSKKRKNESEVSEEKRVRLED